MKTIYKSSEGKKDILELYDNIMSSCKVPYDYITIKTSYGNTNVISFGQKKDEAVILLHGSSTNSAMWLGDVEKLTQKYSVYAIDIIGEPGKSSENRPVMQKNNYGKWIDEIMKHLGLEKAHFMGNSLGGWMALDYATYRPERVIKLVLIAASGIQPAKISFLLKIIPLMLFRKNSFEKINKIVYGNISINEVDERVLAFGRLIMGSYNPRMGALPIFSDNELRRLTMPTLYIAGEKDALLHSEKSAERLNRLLPNVKTEILKDNGHVIYNQTQNAFNFLDN